MPRADILLSWAGDASMTLGEVKCVADNVLVQVTKVEEETASGIALAAGVSEQTRTTSGVVVKTGTGRVAADGRRWHEDAQYLLASWCCTSELAFKGLAGRVPYLLPPLPPAAGQPPHWKGNPWLRWEAEALAAAYAAANDTATAAAFNASVSERCAVATAWQCKRPE